MIRTDRKEEEEL